MWQAENTSLVFVSAPIPSDTHIAVHYMQQGGDVYKLSRLLGHENITTTERYLRAFQARDARRGMSVLDQLDRG
jgi:integrase